MLYCSTIVGFPILFVAMIVTGELKIAWPACAQVIITRTHASCFRPCFLLTFFLFFLQHPYVYGVLVFEACATFVGQVSVLSLVAIFGAATTTMVCFYLDFSFSEVVWFISLWPCIHLQPELTICLNLYNHQPRWHYQITTARKAVTLLLSYLIFTKPLTEQHGTGLLLMSMCIIMKMLPDNKPPQPRPQKILPLQQTEKPRDPEVNRFQIGTDEEEEKRPLV